MKEGQGLAAGQQASGFRGHILEQDGTSHCLPGYDATGSPHPQRKPEGHVEVATEDLEGAMFSLKM